MDNNDPDVWHSHPADCKGDTTSARRMRLALTILAVMLPGPWTPVILLIYVLGRANDPDNPTHHAVPDPAWSRPNPDPNPYACPRS